MEGRQGKMSEIGRGPILEYYCQNGCHWLVGAMVGWWGPGPMLECYCQMRVLLAHEWVWVLVHIFRLLLLNC